MTFLTSSEKTAISQQIKVAESRTSGEIMTVIARQSDGYRFIPMLWAALIALSVPGLVFLYNSITQDGWSDPNGSANEFAWLYPVQVMVFFGLGTLFQISAARVWMIPKNVKRQRAARFAREVFFSQNLHLTEQRTGVLIFVSVAEHYVEIIVDQGISECVDNSIWDETVENFVNKVRQGKISDGFTDTIEHCREVLCEHFPSDSKNADELPNHLIEI